MGALTITPLGFAAGAEVSGFDLREPLDAADRIKINEAWLRHLVLVFPQQDLTPEQQIAFARNSVNSTGTSRRRRPPCTPTTARSWC
jgi:taurine dioxygenase